MEFIDANGQRWRIDKKEFCGRYDYRAPDTRRLGNNVITLGVGDVQRAGGVVQFKYE